LAACSVAALDPGEPFLDIGEGRHGDTRLNHLLAKAFSPRVRRNHHRKGGAAVLDLDVDHADGRAIGDRQQFVPAGAG
jgi:hypothetical protein